MCSGEAQMLFKSLRALQRQCDELSFSINGKKFHNVTEAELLAHQCFHLGKLVGKVAAVCEAREHGTQSTTDQIKREVIPDLIIYALQLANLYDVDIDSGLVERMRFVLNKIDFDGSDSKTNMLQSLKAILGEKYF
jgi:hypothetical protein